MALHKKCTLTLVVLGSHIGTSISLKELGVLSKQSIYTAACLGFKKTAVVLVVLISLGRQLHILVAQRNIRVATFLCEIWDNVLKTLVQHIFVSNRFVSAKT